jgi:hypothetical protein
MMKLLVLITSLILSTAAFAAESVSDSLRYVDADLPNVSDALFKKGILKTDDSAAVEEYIRIHHCGLYEQYQRDDFAWTRIREAQARDLDVRIPSMPDGLEIASTLYLDQYDLANNQFTIRLESQLNNVGNITVYADATGSINICDQSFIPRVHPLELQLKLDIPVTMTAIPMSRATADALLAIMNARGHMAEKEKRKVVLTFRVRVTGVDPLSVVTDPMHRTVLGQLDDVRVYEGPERKMLVFRKEYESLRAKAGKK